MCPFCQKTFKTSVLCKKHMKIHRKDLAAKVTATEELPTIESRDVARPEETLDKTKDPTFFTADSSGNFYTIFAQFGKNNVFYFQAQ